MEVTTYFLQMQQAPRAAPVKAPPGASVVHAPALSASEYRELYLEVGAPWLWYERAQLADHELERLIHEDGVSIFVLMFKGSSAGYAEIRHSTTADGELEAQLLYFGLKRPFIGKGLGRYLLDWSIRQSFTRAPRRLWVHTCSLDHERALATYEAAGFTEFRREYGWVRIPQEALDRQEQAHARRHAAPAHPV